MLLLSRSWLMCAAVRTKARFIKIENPSADLLPMKGVDWLKAPIRMKLEAGKTYSWCSCGHSVRQPWCDGTHKKDGLTTLRPVRFQVEKTGEYSLCGCKHTEKRPLCDASHRKPGEISMRPKSADASQSVMFGDSPVYDGVAYKLGYKPKYGGFH
ncbi:hypothetical protein AB6A40_003446 [Gnathostoma spinigerum]|uniref:Iron-binding zinc finger CDGSH type domain-containing protein n=1 Tax=Gnathostoma spinigerum TaxID=75299 RepID=A0ABD6EBU5_9BILA